MDKTTDPIRTTDDAARTLARDLINKARVGSLGVINPITNTPLVTRVGVGTDRAGHVISLVSSLSQHTSCLREIPSVSLLLGEADQKGDPLTHPRITLVGNVRFVEHSDPSYPELADQYLKTHPKSKLYIGFGDFLFLRFGIETAFLNGGFGKAFELTADDLKPDRAIAPE